MFLKKCDLFSPKITLYYQGHPAHTSNISGALTIFYYIIIIISIIYYLVQIFCKKEKGIFYYNNYIDDPGETNLNSSYLFHFLNLKGEISFDNKAISIIGIKRNSINSLNSRSFKNVNYWTYSECDFNNNKFNDFSVNLSDTKGLCIQSFYNHETNELLNIHDKNFIFPSIEHGTDNEDFNPYVILFQKCKNESLKVDCYSSEEIQKYINKINSFVINIIETRVNVENFKYPVKPYKRSIEVEMDVKSVLSTNLHLISLLVKTHDGILFDSIKNIFGHALDNVSQGKYEKENSSLLATLSFLVHNKMTVFERKYTKITAMIADISGISKLASSIFYFLNFFFCQYNTYLDFFNYMKFKVRKTKNIFERRKTIIDSSNIRLPYINKTPHKKTYDINILFNGKKNFDLISTIKGYLKLKKGKQMKELIKIREKIICEERMIKLYLHIRNLKKLFLFDRVPKGKIALINTFFEKDYKKYENIKGDNSNHDLFNSTLKDGKI